MAKPYIFVTRRLQERVLEPLQSVAEVAVWNDEEAPPRDVILKAAAQADALVTLLTEQIDGELLAAAPRLRLVANVAVGYDHVDLTEASHQRVLVTNTPDVLTETTADLAFALLMAAARRVAEGDRYVRSGMWRKWGFNLFLGQDVYGATLGIIGMGRIGQAMARRARGFGMRCLYYSRTRKPTVERRYRAQYADLDDLLERADFISLHLPLTDETRHLIGERELALMKPSAILINTSRGPVVDQQALYRVLKQGVIDGAGLDVTDPEPLPMDSPILELDNLTVTPHIGSASAATRRRMAEIAVANVMAMLSGKTPPNVVNREILPEWRRLVRTSSWTIGGQWPGNK